VTWLFAQGCPIRYIFIIDRMFGNNMGYKLCFVNKKNHRNMMFLKAFTEKCLSAEIFLLTGQSDF